MNELGIRINKSSSISLITSVIVQLERHILKQILTSLIFCMYYILDNTHTDNETARQLTHRWMWGDTIPTTHSLKQCKKIENYY